MNNSEKLLKTISSLLENGILTSKDMREEITNDLKFKIGVVNEYNTSTATAAYSAHTLTFSTSGLDNSRHNFHISFNAEQGSYKLYVDSLEQQTISLGGTKFSFLPVFNSNLVVGTTPYIHNILLCVTFKLNYYLISLTDKTYAAKTA